MFDCRSHTMYGLCRWVLRVQQCQQEQFSLHIWYICIRTLIQHMYHIVNTLNWYMLCNAIFLVASNMANIGNKLVKMYQNRFLREFISKNISLIHISWINTLICYIINHIITILVSIHPIYFDMIQSSCIVTCKQLRAWPARKRTTVLSLLGLCLFLCIFYCKHATSIAYPQHDRKQQAEWTAQSVPLATSPKPLVRFHSC